MSWVITVIVRHIISLVVAVRPQAIPDRVGGSAVRGAPFDRSTSSRLRANVVHTLPLITRPTEHSGVTFGAATSVLLTGVGEIYLQEHYKKGVRRFRQVTRPAEGSASLIAGYKIPDARGRDGTRLRFHVSSSCQTQDAASKEKPTRRKALGGVQYRVTRPAGRGHRQESCVGGYRTQEAGAGKNVTEAEVGTAGVPTYQTLTCL